MKSRLWNGLKRRLLSVRAIRRLVVNVRIIWFVKIRRQLKSLGDAKSAPGTVTHNLRSLRSIGTRAEDLIRAVSLAEDVRDGSTLIIGCRNEDDLFVAQALGFKSVVGLDLLSYSNKVVLGDMHEIDFPDNYFDAVVVPYTLSYSADARRAVSEFIRVCKDGGVLGIAVEYSEGEADLSSVGNLFQPADGYAYRSIQAILSLLGQSVGDVFVQYDGLKRRQHSPAGLIPNPSPVILACTLDKSS